MRSSGRLDSLVLIEDSFPQVQLGVPVYEHLSSASKKTEARRRGREEALQFLQEYVAQTAFIVPDPRIGLATRCMFDKTTCRVTTGLWTDHWLTLGRKVCVFKGEECRGWFAPSMDVGVDWEGGQNDLARVSAAAKYVSSVTSATEVIPIAVNARAVP